MSNAIIENFFKLGKGQGAAITSTQKMVKAVAIAQKPIKQVKAGSAAEFALSAINILNPINMAKLLYGSPEAKAQAAFSTMPVTVKTVTKTPIGKRLETQVKTESLGAAAQTEINTQKATSPALRTEWETPTLGNTNITLPEIKIPDLLGGLGDLGKYALIGGIALVALIIVTRGKK
jgi:hypothetical protein